MTVNRTTLLDLPLPVTGTESGAWGDITNNGLTQYLDIAIAGTLVLNTDADVTLTSTEGDSSATYIGATTAQYAILRWTATGSTTRNITALAQSKTYVVINATGGTQSIVLRGAGPTTGVTIISGEKAHCVWNGSDFVKVSSSAAAGGSNTQVQYNSSGVLAGVSGATTNGTAITFSTTNLKLQGSSTGVSSFASANSSATDYTVTFPAASTTIPIATQTLTFSGPTAARTITLPDANFTAARTDAAQTFTGTQTFSSDPVLSGGTANGVLYLNGSKVATSGSALTFDGTNLSVGTTALSGGKFSTLADLTAVNGLVVRDSATTYANNDNYVLLQNSAGGTAGALTHPAASSLGVWGNDDIRFLQGAGASEAMRLTSTGLGIGTSSPAAKLDIGSGNIYVRTGTTYSNTISPYSGDLTIDYGSSPNVLKFTTGATERMRLDSSGNLGIGTSSPGAKLDVNGEVRALFSSGFTLYNAGSQISKLYYNGGLILDRAAGTNLYFTLNGSNQATLDSSGNLGLGVTPSAWALSGSTAFQVRNAAVAGFQNRAYLFANAYFNSGGSNLYIANDYATAYEQSSGQHAWKTAPSGTAGNAITFTQAMTLDASGNLGVGTTSPGCILDVQSASPIVKATATTGTNPATFRVVNTGGTSYFGRDSSSGGFTGTAYATFIWGNGAYPLAFATNDIERARITSGGNLLVGETSDYLSTRLLVDSASTDNSTNILTLRDSGNTDRFRVRSDGYTYAGFYPQTTGSAANVFIDAGGDLLRSTSSLKYKRDVQDAIHGLAEVMALRSVTYKGKSENDGDKIFGGLIAEEVHAAGLTEFVQYAEDGTPDALAYGNMVSLCIKAIQEQQTLIESLTSRVAQLEGTQP